MVSSVYWEWELFLLSIKVGIKIAFIYEVIVIFRMFVAHCKWVRTAQDLVYWIYAATILYQLQYKHSNGVLRGFSILGVFLGMVLYYIVVGNPINKLLERRRSRNGGKKNSSKKKETK